MTEVAIQANDLAKTYTDAGMAVNVLKRINLQVARGEQIAIVGASGSCSSARSGISGRADFGVEGAGAGASSGSPAGFDALALLLDLLLGVEKIGVLGSVCIPNRLRRTTGS